MKHLVLTLAGLAAAGSLVACSKKETATPEVAAAPAAVPSAAAPSASGSDMAAMGATAGAKMAKGTGTVTAIDAKAGTITLDHGAIPEANWPAMTMGFKAGPSVTQAVKVGDKVAFDIKIQDGAGEVTAVHKQ
jgi:Cu/Ag efflux protein CusF